MVIKQTLILFISKELSISNYEVNTEIEMDKLVLKPYEARLYKIK